MVTAVRVVHLLSASIWVGGTAALVFVCVPAIRRLEGEARATARRRLVVVGWLSFAATAAVPILGVVVLGYVD